MAEPWRIDCAWCDWYVLGWNRGSRGAQSGSGHEAAKVMEDHVAHKHGRTWPEYLAASHV